MALGVDAFDQLRVAFRHPAEDKEGDLDIGIVEQLQQPVGVFFHPRRPLRPFGGLDDIGEGGDLVVVLHIDGHRVGHGVCFHNECL